MKNECLLCHNEITIEDLKEQVETGILHPHCCRNCVKPCQGPCGETKSLSHFPYATDSEAFKIWTREANRKYPGPKEASQNVCGKCQQETRSRRQALLEEERKVRAEQAQARQAQAMRDPKIQLALKKMLTATVREQ